MFIMQNCKRGEQNVGNSTFYEDVFCSHKMSAYLGVFSFSSNRKCNERLEMALLHFPEEPNM